MLPGLHIPGLGEESEGEADEEREDGEADAEAGERGHVLHVALGPGELAHVAHAARGGVDPGPVLLRQAPALAAHAHRHARHGAGLGQQQENIFKLSIDKTYL